MFASQQRTAVRRFAVWLVCFLGLGCCHDAVRAAESFDWSVWRELPVQHGGRQKPLDTLSRESLRLIANRSSLPDPETGQALEPTAWYLGMVLQWQGWESRDREHLELIDDWRHLYGHLHTADAWDRMPLLRVDFPSLRAALRLEKDQSHLAPATLATAKIDDVTRQQSLPFSTWAEQVQQRQQADEELTDLEQHGLQLANQLWSYQNLRMGRSLEVLPLPNDSERKWLPLALLWVARLDSESDPSGALRGLQQQLQELRQAFLRQDAAAFNRLSRQLVGQFRELGSSAGDYPSEGRMSLEVRYNRWSPFRVAWIAMLVATIAMLLFLGTGWRGWRWSAWGSYTVALLAMFGGFATRIIVSGRPPVANMFESVVYVGSGVAVLGMVFEWLYRRHYILTAAAAVSTITLALADNSPLVLDPSMRPLEPVLRSNFWLMTHVMTITLSYAALALATGIANITLGFFLVGSDRRETIHALSRFTYQTIQVGVWLLAAGIFLGGVWADYTWGRFWGWDPKEVWALVALIGYLALLHARFAGWLGPRGLAAWSVGCFSLVVMAWYGVNFVLGAGLHSYGFGGGGQAFVYCAVGLQLFYALGALFRSAPETSHANIVEPR